MEVLDRADKLVRSPGKEALVLWRQTLPEASEEAGMMPLIQIMRPHAHQWTFLASKYTASIADEMYANTPCFLAACHTSHSSRAISVYQYFKL